VTGACRVKTAGGIFAYMYARARAIDRWEAAALLRLLGAGSRPRCNRRQSNASSNLSPGTHPSLRQSDICCLVMP
jgi:hypothetical protein